MKSTLKASGVAIAMLALAGCETTSTILEAINLESNSYSIDAKQRIVISANKDEPREKIICAEPSPDAVVAAAFAFAAEAEVAGKGGGGFSTGVAETAASIGLRTATIQLLRDGLYRACEAYLNGALNEFGYGLILSSYDDVLLGSLGIEGLTRIPAAAQFAIGTKTTTKTGPGDETGASAEATSPAEAQPSAAQPAKASIGAVATAVTKLGRRGTPISSFAGACLMWASRTDVDPEKPQHQVMLDYFERAMMLQGRAIAAKASPANRCMAWLLRTDMAERDERQEQFCENIVLAAMRPPHPPREGE